jgi:hypothetical protein
MSDGAIYKACGNRRATVCPSCAETYRQDAYQLIRGQGHPRHRRHPPGSVPHLHRARLRPSPHPPAASPTSRVSTPSRHGRPAHYEFVVACWSPWPWSSST